MTVSQPQWIDRFLNSLSARVPTVSVDEATAWAEDAWRLRSDRAPEDAVASVVADLRPDPDEVVDGILHVDRDVILTPLKRALGVGAALEVFEHAGLKPGRCEAAYFEREAWQLLGQPRWITPTAQQEQEADIWALATAEAKRACGGDLCLEPVVDP